MKLSIYPLSFRKRDIGHIPVESMVQYLTITHVVNDVNRLLKQAILSLNASRGDVPHPVAAASFAGMLMNLRLLAGRLHEAQGAVNSRGMNDLVRSLDCPFQRRDQRYDELLVRLSASRKAFNASGQASGYVSYLRNKLAFHTEVGVLREAYAEISEDAEMVEYLARDQGNTLYSAAELLILHSMTRAFPGDLVVSLNQMRADVQDVAGHLSDFASVLSSLFAARYMYKDLKLLQQNAIEIEGVPSITEAELSFFLGIPHDLAKRAGLR